MTAIPIIIAGLEEALRDIEKAIGALRGTPSAAPAKKRRGRPPKKHRYLSPEARRRISEAQKARWAAARDAGV
jgi:hypothetical protein